MTDYPIKVTCVPVQQSIGTFYVGVMEYRDALSISSTNQREFDSESDDFVGIQRPLKKSRVKEIAEYLRGNDATFPTSVIFALDSRCVELEYPDDGACIRLIISPNDEVPEESIAKIIDGQHRLAGLRNAKPENFQISCTFFVGADTPDQAIIFATVNLTQSKINRSQAYDLLAFATERSPERVLHEVVVALDKNGNSPFKGMIKRLGVATPERGGETIAQAAFFDGILPYLTNDAVADRNAALKKRQWPEIRNAREKGVIFRNLFTEGRDDLIYANIARYFAAIKDRWPNAWAASGHNESIIAKTTGFLAFSRFLRNVFDSQDSEELSRAYCSSIFDRISMMDDEFTSERFPSGSVGQRRLYERLVSDAELR